MKIGLIKPDYKLVGGFEILTDLVTRQLSEDGHEIKPIPLPVVDTPDSVFGISIEESSFVEAHEYFRYMALVEAIRDLSVEDVDAVISTQPPSFGVSHPRHLSIFYHHLRIYYDLSEAYMRAGFAKPETHLACQAVVREVDAEMLRDVTTFLAPEAVVERLGHFNDLRSNVRSFNVTSPLAIDTLSEATFEEFDYPLCVTRHEFPKRAELFIHAMKFLPHLEGVVVGDGGRLPWIRHLDRTLSDPAADLEGIREEALWLNRGEYAGGDRLDSESASNVRFLTQVSHSHLRDLYRKSLCVVAPALLEDYGLTAIEGMAAGKPVIVCADGGGLEHLVADGVNGFVVPPSGQAIAEKIRLLRTDPDLARELGLNARLTAHQFTQERTSNELRGALQEVLS